MIATSDEEIVVVREDYPLVAFGVGRDFCIGSIVFQFVLDSSDSDAVGIPKRRDVLSWDVLVAENPHLFVGATLRRDRLLSGLFLCPKRLHQFRVIVVVLGGGPNLSKVKVQLVSNLVEAPLAVMDQLADLKNADACALEAGLSVEHIWRFHDLDRGTHLVQTYFIWG